MSSEANSGKGYSIKAALIAGLCLGAIAGAGIWYGCSIGVEQRRSAVIRDYSEMTEQWLKGTSAAMEQWVSDSREQRGRISSSETFRMFAGDLMEVGSRAAGSINDSGRGAVFSGQEMVELSEEVPAIRRVLLDFMNYNGLMDARIVNGEAQTLLSAMATPSALSDVQKDAVRTAFKENRPVYLPVRGGASGLLLDVCEPMVDIEGRDRNVAVFFSSQPVLGHVTQLLARARHEDMATAVLLQKNGAAWEKIQVPSPRPVDAVTAAELEKSAGAVAFAERAALSGISEPVYSASKFVPAMNWSLVYEIPSSVVERRLMHAALPIYVMGGLCWAIIMLMACLVWWIGMGRQQKAVAGELFRLNSIITRQKELLDSVNISLDLGLFMADVKGQVIFCNRAEAEILGREEVAVNGQMLFSLLPVDTASMLLDRIRKVAIEKVNDSCEFTMEKAGVLRLYRVALFPFMEAGSDGTVRGATQGAVVTMTDITEFRRRSERMRMQQRSLVEAFTRAEESVDPYLYGHSRRMSSLGDLLARHLGMDEDSRTTVVMGALLSQMGKLFIPHELLTKKGRLTEEELIEVRKAPEHAYKLLKDIDFDLPIARAVYEMYENMDGSGYPRGVAGKDILPEARVLAVLNAFCALVSARSYRQGMSEEDALAELRRSAKFESSVVEGLAAVLGSPEGALAVHS